MAYVGGSPTNRFPLGFYRDNCADIALTIDEVEAASVTDSCVLDELGSISQTFADLQLGTGGAQGGSPM